MPVIPLPANSVVLVSAVGNCNGQRIINTFHYRMDSAPSASIDYQLYLDALAAELISGTGLITAFRAALPANYTIEKLRIQPVFPTRMRYNSTSLVLSGTFPGGFLATAQNQAASVKRVSGRIGPAGVGRVQMVAPEQQASGGFFVDVNNYLSKLADFGSKFLDVITTITPAMTWVPVLYGPAYSFAGLDDLIDWEVEPTVRTMHRRTTFLGE